MIKAIIFDYFGVVSSDEYWDFVGSDKDLTTEWLNLANKVNLGKLTWQEFLQGLAEETHKPLEEIKRVYEQEKINPRVLAFAQELHAHYKTGLLSNAHHDFLEPIVKHAHLDEVFDAIVISSRVGVVKPDARIFELILDKLGVSAEEALFIDDIERNVAGGEAVGIKGIHYQSLDQLKRDLGRLL